MSNIVVVISDLHFEEEQSDTIATSDSPRTRSFDYRSGLQQTWPVDDFDH